MVCIGFNGFLEELLGLVELLDCWRLVVGGEVRALPLIISELQLQVGGHSSGGNCAITSSVKCNRGKTQCFTLNGCLHKMHCAKEKYAVSESGPIVNIAQLLLCKTIRGESTQGSEHS